MNRPRSGESKPLSPFLLLIRGLPGSGKSTLARKLACATQACPQEADFFFEQPDGTYLFDSSLLKEAHSACLDATRTTLKAGRNCIVANTFTQMKELAPYLQLCYPYAVITCAGEYTSIHGVPQKTLENMAKRWEAFYYASGQDAHTAIQILKQLPPYPEVLRAIEYANEHHIFTVEKRIEMETLSELGAREGG